MRSLRYALTLAGGYAVLAGIYIVISSSIAAGLAADVEQMRRIEVLKGVLYVVVTAIGVFLGAWLLLGRIERFEGELRLRDQVLLANERRIFAGVLAGTVAHDANNVLMSVLLDLERLADAAGPAAPHVERLTHSVDRLIALNRRLVDTARHGRSAALERIDLGQETSDLVAGMRRLPALQGCRVTLARTRALELHAHRALIHPIVSNLVLNAAEATGGRGRVDVRVGRDDAGLTLEVHDDGPGVPADRRLGLFDALETSKPEGNGLGLFSVQACARALGGTVAVSDSPLGGACFRVTLPASGHAGPARTG